jgi:hypothetical protein
LLAGWPALRVLIGLLLAASIFVAAFASQSSHIDPAELTVVRWVAQLGSTSSEPRNQSERRDPAAQLNAVESMASQPTRSPQTAPQEVAAPASLSLDQAQMLQAIARDVAKLGQRIEELNTRQEQMAGENAKAIEQLTASQDELARDNAKTSEEIKAGREQMARFLAAKVSEQNLQPKTPGAAGLKPATPEEKPTGTTENPAAVEEKPTVVEAKPAAAETKPAPTEGTPAAKQSAEATADEGKPAVKPEDSAPSRKRAENRPRERSAGPSGCTQFRSYNAASATYQDFDGRTRPCR